MHVGQRTSIDTASPGTQVAYLNRIGTAVPAHDVHQPFVGFAADMLHDERTRSLFLRMAARSGIRRRFSVLNPDPAQAALAPELDALSLYQRGAFPATSHRMRLFEQTAPVLARQALDRLSLTPAERDSISHVMVTSCTGLYAPGLDFQVIDHLGLRTSVERTMIGFMGCYAAMNALKLARHIVRSEPASSVLILNLELCTLHLQETQSLEQVLSFLVFADGCAASLISAAPAGLALDSFHAVVIPGTRDLITWNIRELGFDMLLSGQVPTAIARSLRTSAREITGRCPTCPPAALPHNIDHWAVHPGGRSVLDAVEDGLALGKNRLSASRHVLECFGNMSSATVMFVLDQILRSARPKETGCAMSFGPGLTAETMRFHIV